MEKYKDFLYQKEKKELERNCIIREGVNKSLPDVLESVTAKYPEIIKIIVFGSFVEGGFNKYSDLDIFAEGLSAKNFFEAKRILEELLDIDVDLYNDSDSSEFIDKIKDRGVTVYERKA